MKHFPEWASMMLKLAGITNAFWGLTFTLFPDILFRWAGIPEPHYLFPWKMIGVIAVVFGVFYFVAAFNPTRHIMVIGMGLIVKLTEFIFVLVYWLKETFPTKLVLYFFAKDLIWIFPLAVVLYLVIRIRLASQSNLRDLSLADILPRLATTNGKNLNELSNEQPVLLIFLRYFGCASCHEALTEIRSKREAIEQNGVKIVLVHMASPEEAQQYFRQYELQNIDHLSDPDCTLYEIFRLRRASLRQMLDLKTWKSQLETMNSRKHNIGIDKPSGDRFRMPGIFLIYQKELLKSYKHEYISDRPDYIALASL